MSFDALILGAGAAGCMAAIQAGKRGRRVLLIDGGKRVGGKIPISGGGRCNFTNRGASAGNYLCSNPHFIKSALARFSAADTESWVAGAGIPYHEKALGQLFCDRSAMDIVELLERELADAGVTLKLNARIEGLEQGVQGFRAFGEGWQAVAPLAVLALGGKSYPVLGASDIGLRIAQSFGLPLVEDAPALDGFVFGPDEAALFDGLAGLATDVVLGAGGRRYAEAALITHKGLSGPAALQGSLWWRPGQSVELDWAPGLADEESLLRYKRQHPRAGLGNWLADALPKRLALALAQDLLPGSEDLNRVPDPRLREACAGLHQWRFTPAGTVGWHKAEVMRGGVDVDALDQKTLQARAVPGLYCIGEMVDVTGELGGYNFQWAWASGAAAGRAL
jgi:predicted Rossmann fold flavoprotein